MRGGCGRLAPTPTGLLHLGHAATFSVAWQRARANGGRLLLRMEDLDHRRCCPQFAGAAIRDLAWLGLDWDGEPVFQSARRALYLEAWKRLREGGWIYPCRHSRREIAEAAPLAPHSEEPLFPTAWRAPAAEALRHASPEGLNWRFRVPDGEAVEFDDRRLGRLRWVAGRDFGDFLVWNRDNVPAYELAVVVDDLALGITEIVRGEDLVLSTARQKLVARALGAEFPATFHCPLARDASGRRLSKRTGALAIAALREAGRSPQEVLEMARAAAWGGSAE